MAIPSELVQEAGTAAGLPHTTQAALCQLVPRGSTSLNAHLSLSDRKLRLWREGKRDCCRAALCPRDAKVDLGFGVLIFWGSRWAVQHLPPHQTSPG